MGGLRNAHGICPPEVLGFLLDLFKYNDNSRNTLSDSYYCARLVDETVTLVVSMLQVRGRRVRVCGSNVYYLSINKHHKRTLGTSTSSPAAWTPPG